jgi:uncharacterized ion transporter superfamily protein YfcC
MPADDHASLTRTHRTVLWIFAGTLAAMVVGVVHYGWFIEEIAALFLAMAIVVGIGKRWWGPSCKVRAIWSARRW